jgi:hypothetical protein
MLNNDYQIKIELENSHLIAKNIRLINIDYEMTLSHNIPYIDRLEDLDEAQRIKDEAESYSNYARNNQSDTFEFGGLSGEEAETLYWNID